MESSKIKEVIILMLAIVNAFLLVLVVGRAWKSAQAQDLARTQVLGILAENGIAMAPEALPEETMLAGGTVSRDATAEVLWAQGLLGQDTQLDGDGMTYEGECGSARFYVDGEFYALLKPEIYGINPEQTDRQTVAVAVLDKMGFQGRVVEETAQGVVIEQTLNGVPLFSCRATVLFQGDWVQGIEVGSRRLVGTPQMGEAQALLSVPRALLSLLDYVKANGDLCSEIHQMTLGYVLDSQSIPAVLYPTWQVTTDVGHYTVDGVTGIVKGK